MQQIIFSSVFFFIALDSCAPDIWYNPASSYNLGENPIWNWVSSQTLRWTTEFKTFSICLTQNVGPDSSSVFCDTILANVSSISECVWNVTTNLDIQPKLPFSLAIQDAAGHVHIVQSGDFNISNKVILSNSNSILGVPVLTITSLISASSSDLTSILLLTQSSIEATIVGDPISTPTNTAVGSTNASTPPSISDVAKTAKGSIIASISKLASPAASTAAIPKASSTTTTSIKAVSLKIGIGITVPIMLILRIVTGLGLKRNKRLMPPLQDRALSIVEVSQLEVPIPVQEL